MINIKNLNPNKIKKDEKSYESNVICYIGSPTPNSLKPLYLIFNKANRFIDQNNKKNLALVTTDEIKEERHTENLGRTMEENQSLCPIN